jgi:hypothetical protein
MTSILEGGSRPQEQAPGGGATSEWAARIGAAWRRTLESVIDTGRLLVEAKAPLPHGEFLAMVERDLPFGPRTAQMLMTVASDDKLTNANHAPRCPLLGQRSMN